MRTALFATLLFAFACGNDDGLTISGQITVDAEGTMTGFEFPEETRLVDLALEEDTGTQLAGSCRVVGDDATIVVGAPGEPPAGLGLHRVELSIPAEGSGGFAIAQLGTDEYSAALGADCSIESLELDDDGGEVYLSLVCALEGPDAANATLDAAFELEGCAFE